MQHDDYQSFIDSSQYNASGSVPPMSHPSPQRNGQGQLSHYLDHQQHDDHENDQLPLIYEQPVSDCGDTDTTLMHDPNDYSAFFMNGAVGAGFPMPQPIPNTIDPSILSSGSPSSGHSFPNSHSPHYQLPMLPDPSDPSSLPRKESLSPLNLASLTGSLPNGHHSSPHLTTPHSSHSGGAETPSGSSCGSEIWETSSQNDFLQDGELLSPDEARGLGRSSSDSKVYRRTIEKKSRDKKTKAFEKLKQQLHLSTTKSFDSRSQYEVFEASARALAEHRAKEQQLVQEVQLLRRQLLAQQQLNGYGMQN